MGELTRLVTCGVSSSFLGFLAERLLNETNVCGHSYKVLSILPTTNSRYIHGAFIGAALFSCDLIVRKIFENLLEAHGYSYKNQDADGHVQVLSLACSLGIVAYSASKIFCLSRQDALILALANVVFNIVARNVASQFNPFPRTARV